MQHCTVLQRNAVPCIHFNTFSLDSVDLFVFIFKHITCHVATCASSNLVVRNDVGQCCPLFIVCIWMSVINMQCRKFKCLKNTHCPNHQWQLTEMSVTLIIERVQVSVTNSTNKQCKHNHDYFFNLPACFQVKISLKVSQMQNTCDYLLLYNHISSGSVEMSESSSDTESSCGWTIISNEVSQSVQI